jgi:plastocyanin domain-containing protein
MNTNIKLVIGAIVLVGGVYWFGQQGNTSERFDSLNGMSSNVRVENGTQVVTITAKGGYLPAVSTILPGMPTIVRFDTSGTYDCSAAVRIPDLGIKQTLPANGSTDIAIGTMDSGDSVVGTCGMGMYRFELRT